MTCKNTTHLFPSLQSHIYYSFWTVLVKIVLVYKLLSRFFLFFICLFVYLFTFFPSFRGIKLIERNEEVCVFYETLNIQGKNLIVEYEEQVFQSI